MEVEAAGVDDLLVPVPEQEIEVSANQWACPKCDTVYNSRPVFRVHLKKKHGLVLKDIEQENMADKHRCPVYGCGKKHTTKNALKVHLHGVHNTNESQLLPHTESRNKDVCVAELPVEVQARFRQLQQEMWRAAADVRQLSSSSSSTAPTSIGDIHSERRQRKQTDLFNRRVKKRKRNVDSGKLIVSSGIVAPELRTTQKSANRVKRDQAIAEEVTVAYNL